MGKKNHYDYNNHRRLELQYDTIEVFIYVGNTRGNQVNALQYLVKIMVGKKLKNSYGIDLGILVLYILNTKLSVNILGVYVARAKKTSWKKCRS